MNSQIEMPLGAPAYVPFQAPPPPFVRGSDTSFAAAKAIKDDGAKLRAKVFNCVLQSGSNGRTDEEMQTELSIAGSTQRPRRRELELSGRIRKSDFTRPTASGRMAAVWIVSASTPTNP